MDTDSRPSAPKPRPRGGCRINVHQHCGARTAPPTATGGEPTACFPPPAEGSTCLPPVAGRKAQAEPGAKARAPRRQEPRAQRVGCQHDEDSRYAIVCRFNRTA